MNYDSDFGICFSGGGSRASAFCSGVLCQLIHNKTERKLESEPNPQPSLPKSKSDKVSLGYQLPKYFSCVSGGGYVGASFLHWARKHKGEGKDVSVWSEDYFIQMYENISYLISCHSGQKSTVYTSRKALKSTVFYISSFLIWSLSILLNVLCEVYIFYKFIAIMVWPNGLTSRIGVNTFSADWNFTTFHILNKNSRPVFNYVPYTLGACMFIVYVFFFYIKILLIPGIKDKKSKHRALGVVFLQTISYFSNAFFSMYLGVFVAALLHYSFFDDYGVHYIWMAPVCLCIEILLNLLIIYTNRRFNFIDYHKVHMLCFHFHRIISMLFGGYVIFWNISYFDDEEVFFFHFSNLDFYTGFDHFIYACLFCFPWVVYFVQNAFSERQEENLKTAFYKDDERLCRVLLTLCCRRNCRFWEDGDDWIYGDGDNTLPTFDSVCTVYWQRGEAAEHEIDSSIMTFSSDGQCYNFQRNTQFETGRIGGKRLRLSKVMALSGGAISLKMGSFFDDNSLYDFIFHMFANCLTHMGASMGGWIRTKEEESFDSLYLFVLGPVLMAPLVVMIIMADGNTPYLAIFGWFGFFILYFMMWNVGHLYNKPQVKWCEYFYYPFKLSFLIGDPTWYNKDPPCDRMYLTDGGHKDNYGLASLILRRRCEKILICEGSQFGINPLKGLLIAFYWSNCLSDVPLKFDYYDKKKLDWEKVKNHLYEDFYLVNFRKELLEDCSCKSEMREKINEKVKKMIKQRKEFSEAVLDEKCDIDPYCWKKGGCCIRFRVTYTQTKVDETENVVTYTQTKVDETENVDLQHDPQQHGPRKDINEAFLWFVAPPSNIDFVKDKKAHCKDHTSDKKLDAQNLSGCLCECCHDCNFCDRKCGVYPHFNTANQFLTPGQYSALHIAGTYAAKEALGTYAAEKALEKKSQKKRPPNECTSSIELDAMNVHLQ